MASLTSRENAMLMDLLNFGTTTYDLRALDTAEVLERKGWATVTRSQDAVGNAVIVVAPTHFVVPDMGRDPDPDVERWRRYKP